MIATNTLSQSLYLKLTPSVSSFFGTYQTVASKPSNTNNLIETKASRLGNIGIGLVGVSYGLDLSLVKFNKFCLGIAVFNSSSVYGSGAYYDRTPNYIEPPEGYGETYKINYQLTYANNVHNLGLNLGYQMSSKSLIKIGFLFQRDKTSIPEGFDADFMYMYDGAFGYVTTHNDEVMNKKSFGLSFEYEKAFLNKKNKNILSIKIAYLQGFRIMGGSQTNYQHYNLGYNMTIDATSRASGFFIGLSKPITIYEKNN